MQCHAMPLYWTCTGTAHARLQPRYIEGAKRKTKEIKLRKENNNKKKETKDPKNNMISNGSKERPERGRPMPLA